jgi:hypothetical protein
VLQSPFLKLFRVGIHKRNLLKARVVVCSYNDHVRLLSPEPVGWIQHHQLYSRVEADIFMQSITLKTPSMSEMASLENTCSQSLDCNGDGVGARITLWPRASRRFTKRLVVRRRLRLSK